MKNDTLIDSLKINLRLNKTCEVSLAVCGGHWSGAVKEISNISVAGLTGEVRLFPDWSSLSLQGLCFTLVLNKLNKRIVGRVAVLSTTLWNIVV